MTVTATSVADTTKSASATLTVPAAPTITTGALAAGTVGTAYSATLAGSGGISPYAWSLTSGTFPTGITMNSAGVISGTPTAAAVGTANLTFKLTDSGTPTALTATQVLGLTINAAPAITFTGVMPATSTYNASYTGSAAASGGGGPLTYTLNSGALPTGLSLTAATGAVTGTTTAIGVFNFSIKAADAFGDSAAHNYTITVGPATPTLTFAAISTHTYGDAPFTVSATSVSSGAVTYSVTSGPATIAGNLVTLTGAGTVMLGASQAATATYTAASASISFTVNPETPTLTFAAIPTHTFGDAPFTVSATSVSSGAVTYSVTSGPATVAGNTVTLTGAGTVALGASQAASGNYGTASASTSFVVNPALSITTSTTLPSGTVNVAYSQSLAATGGTGTGYNWTVTAGALQLAPLSLSLSSAGVLSGTPTVTGSATFTAQVTDSQSHTSSATFTVTVYAALTVTTSSLPGGDVGSSYSQTLAAAGGTGTGYSWSASSSNLAAYGLSLSSAGIVSGTPTQTGTASFTAKVTDSGSNSGTAPLTITVYGALALPSANPITLPSTGTTGVAYSGTINASGGSGSYSWTVTGLPSDSLGSSASGNILTVSGTPANPATVTFNVKLTDTTTGASVTQNGYTITVSNPTPVTLPSPNPITLPSATVNQVYSGSINASGGVSPFAWTVNETTFPTPGLRIGISNGITVSNNGSNILTVGGTPTATGTVTLTNVNVTDSLSTTATNTYTIAVNSAGSTVSDQSGLNGFCGGSPTLPTFSVSINTSPVQTVNTDSSGNYSFTGVHNGTYTITPSILGPSSVFYPANYSNVVVNNGNVTFKNFQVTLGYTVSGTVTYGGTSTAKRISR